MEFAREALAYLGLHRDGVLAGALLFVLTLAGSIAAMTYVLVRMPEGYLDIPEDTPFWPDRPLWMRISARIGKNVAGGLLVALGVVLSLPGVPGQGVLTVLIGVMLLDIPGKRRFERRVLGQRRVRAAVNRLRARFGRPPLRIPLSPRQRRRASERDSAPAPQPPERGGSS